MSTAGEAITDHPFTNVDGYPDLDECTHYEGVIYCGEPEHAHERSAYTISVEQVFAAHRMVDGTPYKHQAVRVAEVKCTCGWRHTREPELPLGWAEKEIIRALRGDHEAHIVESLREAGIDVVHLPKPDKKPLKFNGAGWTVPAPHHVVFDGYFEVESSDSEFGDADEAEAVGLALVAAARHRRARQERGEHRPGKLQTREDIDRWAAARLTEARGQ